MHSQGAENAVFSREREREIDRFHMREENEWATAIVRLGWRKYPWDGIELYRERILHYTSPYSVSGCVMSSRYRSKAYMLVACLDYHHVWRRRISWLEHVLGKRRNHSTLGVAQAETFT